MRRAGAATLLFGALLAGPATAEEARWWREVNVPSPGPVAVALDGRAADRADFDLEVVAPDGRVIAASVDSGPRGEKRVRLTRVTPTDAGWQVELDAGPAPPLHSGFRFALSRETAAGDVLLEGSDDGQIWRELARSDLFRLGAGEALQGFTFAYEPDGARWLRLSWPQAAGLPELSEAAIVPAEDAGPRSPVTVACDPGPGGRELDCRVNLPRRCRALELRLEPREAGLGFNLWRAANGSWLELGGGERRRQGALRLELAGGEAYRLRLESSGGAPELTGASCEERSRRLDFVADQKGVYRLAYGRLTPPEGRVCCGAGEAPPPSPAPRLLPLGPEQAAAAPPAWPRAAQPGGPLEGDFERTWPVETTAKPGQLMVLALPPETQSATGNPASGLRLEAGGAQLPYLAEIAPLPERLLAKTLRPVAGEKGRSRATLALPADHRDGELVLFARGPFARNLRFVYLEKTGPGRADVERAAGPSREWTCPPREARSCALWVPLHFDGPPTPTGEPRPDWELIVESDDGDNPPLAELTAEVWVRQPLFYFVQPPLPVLLRESRKLAAPRYDFAGLGPGLPREEAAPARPGKAENVKTPAEAPRWLLPVAIGLAALALLGVLARVLRQDPAA